MSDRLPTEPDAAPRRARRRREPAAKTPPRGRKRPFVTLENPETGEIRQVRIGFAWTLFLFSSVLGVPLFLRRLYLWGAAILALWAVNLLVVKFAGGPAAMEEGVLCAVFFGLQLWLGFKGNAITVKTYLRRGWTVAD